MMPGDWMPGWARWVWMLMFATLLLLPQTWGPGAVLLLLLLGVARWQARRHTRTAAGGGAPAVMVSPADRPRALRFWLGASALYFGVILIQVLTGRTASGLSGQVVAAALLAGLITSRLPLQISLHVALRGAALGGIGALVVAGWQAWGLGIARPYGWLGTGVLGSGAIKFADLAGIQALAALLLFARPAARFDRGLGAIGAIAALWALLLTESRGPLLGVVLALAVGAMVWFLAATVRRRSRLTLPRGAAARGTLIAVLLLGLVGVGVGAESGLARFTQVIPQWQAYQASQGRGATAETEVGQRLLLWQVAWQAGVSAPLLGVGVDRLREAATAQAAAGQIPAGSEIHYQHAHNEYLCAWATLGLPGLLGILALLLGPPAWAARQLLRQPRERHDTPRGDARRAQVLLLLTGVAWSVYALTDCLFDRQITLLTFLLMTGWFWRVAAHCPHTAASRPADPIARP